MDRFDRFVKKILINEGGYVNDPKDSGGETKYGISKRAFPELDIKNLTVQKASDIYKKNYYLKYRINEIANDDLALHVFDMCVNAGGGRAIKILQEVCGVHVDGIIGLKTITACNSKDITNEYISKRIAFYRSIGVGKNKRFVTGWIKRVNDLLD